MNRTTTLLAVAGAIAGTVALWRPADAVLIEYTVPAGGPAPDPASVDARPDIGGDQFWDRINASFGAAGSAKQSSQWIAGEPALHQSVLFGAEGGMRRQGTEPPGDIDLLIQQGFKASVRAWLPGEPNVGLPLSDFSAGGLDPHKLNGAAMQVFTNTTHQRRVYGMLLTTSEDGDPVVSLSMASDTFDAAPSSFMREVDGGADKFHTYEMIVQPDSDSASVYVDGFLAIGPVLVDAQTVDTNGVRFGDCCAQTTNVEWALTHVRVQSGDLTPLPPPPSPPVALWRADQSGGWTTAFNWDPISIPSEDYTTVVFGDVIAAPRTVVADTPVTVKGIQFDSAHSYGISGLGSLNLQADSGNTSVVVDRGSHQLQLAVNLQDDAAVNVAPGAELNFHNALNLNGNTLTKSGVGRLAINNVLASGGGTLNVTGGTLSGHGVIGGNLRNEGGTIAPGSSAGMLTVHGDFVQSAGELFIELGGTIVGDQYDRLVATGGMTFSGTVRITLIDDFHPADGNSFDVLDFSSLGGSFVLDLPMLDADLAWNTSAFLTDGVLSVIADSLACDFSGDGNCHGVDIDLLTAEISSGNHNLDFDLTQDALVNNDDLDYWLVQAGTANIGATYLVGDANLDGIVDVSDYNAWNGDKFTEGTNWTDGNFNADNAIDVVDFNLWNAHKFTASEAPAAVVPEPAASVMGSLILICLALRQME